MRPYDITVDNLRHTLRASLHGFWDLATVGRYIADLTAAGSRVSRRREASWWLIDMGDSQVQGREVAEQLQRRLPAIFPPAMTLAVVVHASLTSVQAKRVVPNDHHRHFTNRDQAERWLTEMGMPA